MYLRRYYAEYHCTFNLRFFPFDEQVCKMEFKARTVTRQYLELLPGRLNYKGPEVLVEFIVSNTNMTTAREHTTRSEIRIVINLARQVAKNCRKVPKCLLNFQKHAKKLSWHPYKNFGTL